MIKSFTDINQSKKLAKILPLESADMCYNDGELRIGYAPLAVERDDYLPCWSLAALLDVIPYNVSFNKAVYRFKMVKFFDHWECYHENFGSVSTEIFKANNHIDACVAMIEKLNELNLL